jgi:ABC-type transporter Mla maintaining outer membrane lipid asymmetry ATPase subunit MlaF
MSGGPAVVLENVSKSFGTKPILQDVSFHVHAGEALCILGRSGTGKSVTLKLIISLLKPEQGQIWIEGEEIRACTPRTCLACDERWDFSSRVPHSSIR